MALIDCPECSKKISDKAPSCPNCGVVFHGNEDAQKILKYTEKFYVSGVDKEKNAPNSELIKEQSKDDSKKDKHNQSFEESKLTAKNNKNKSWAFWFIILTLYFAIAYLLDSSKESIPLLGSIGSIMLGIGGVFCGLAYFLLAAYGCFALPLWICKRIDTELSDPFFISLSKLFVWVFLGFGGMILAFEIIKLFYNPFLD